MTRVQPCKEKGVPAGGVTALYVHVPFCQAKCAYCDFYSVPLASAEVGRYLRALERELRAKENCLTRPVDSIFVGGGTPTVVGPGPLRRLLALLRPCADGQTEFTVEADPGTVDAATTAVLAEAGVNRVSLGVQSFQPRELAPLGRRHTPDQAGQAVARLRSAGIANIAVDLIYGIPGQSLESWRDSVRRALGLGIRHLSCYALSFEPGTPLHRRLEAGQLRQVDEQVQRDCYYAAIDLAESAGLEHYELSSFACPRQRCRHNVTYWQNAPYLGVGPAAASYIDGTRRTNRPNLGAYLQSIEADSSPPATCEHLTGRATMAETVMLGLRFIEGLERATFIRRFHQDVAEVFPRTVGRYVDVGALVMTASRLRLDRSALFAADTILADFLAEA